MAATWVTDEDNPLWSHFCNGPDVVVHGVPTLGTRVLPKFSCSILATFFNEYATSYVWRDKTKTGLECCDRVIGLRLNEFNREKTTLKCVTMG